MIRLRAGHPVGAGDLVVIAVERQSMLTAGGDAARWVAAEKRPLAVCVVADGLTRAFDLDGSPLARSWLCERVPGLEEAIGSSSPGGGEASASQPECSSHREVATARS